MRSFIRRITSITTIFALTAALLLLPGCGSKVKSAKQLIEAARQAHGDCEVVSQQESSDHVEVVLRDTLQGFEYKVVSDKKAAAVSGTFYGTVDGVTDYFNQALKDFTLEQAKGDLENLCAKYRISYEPGKDFVLVNFIFPMTVTDADAELALVEAAELLQTYNVNRRLNSCGVYISRDAEWFTSVYGTYDPANANNYPAEFFSETNMQKVCLFGSAVLPECTFRRYQ